MYPGGDSDRKFSQICKHMDACAFLIPIYPKHYHYMYRVLPKLRKVVDVFLVFSNEEDFQAFEQKENIQAILLPFVPKDGIINCKKFYGLQSLLDSKYEYFIVCDAEIDVIEQNFHAENIRKKVREVFQNRRIYGGKNRKETDLEIMSKAANVFSPDEYERIRVLTEGFTLYTWWSDLPVYKREHLRHFFQTVRTDQLTWFHFDHLIYSYYLMLYHSFTLVNLTPIIQREGSLEWYRTNDRNNMIQLERLGYGFSWVSRLLLKRWETFLLRRGAFLIYHCDRNY